MNKHHYFLHKEQGEDLITACFSLQDSCKVVRVKDRSANTSMQKSAMAFIQARLYGPGSRRTTSKEMQQDSVCVFLKRKLDPKTH